MSAPLLPLGGQSGRSPSPTPGSRSGRSRGPVRSRAASPAERRAADGSGTGRSSGAVGEESSKLRVVCRLRPLSEQEKQAGTVPTITASTERAEVMTMRGFQGRQNRSAFRFDHVLTSFSTQLDVFAVSLKPLIPDVLAGYEAAVFAYGQTGTGKTFTMEGDLDSPEQRGLAPRAAEALVQALARGEYTKTSVTASCLEIYNEELTDLLAGPQAQEQRLELRETGHGVCCTGLSEYPVSTVAEIQELMRRAQERRSVRETRANACSSRSHCLFTFRVTCHQAVADGEIETVGKLHLVDLAGSECARKADERAFASGFEHQEKSTKGERERKNINQSLLTLGRVISALRDESSRVPYRDSKLTRLLQEALGGGCKTVMIATISPADSAIDETISTLQYAEQASGIQNRPVASQHHFARTASSSPVGDQRGGATFGEFGALPGEAEACAELQTLQMRVEYLTQEVEEAQAAFERKRLEVQSLHERAELAEEQRAAASADLAEARQRLAERSYALARTAQFADSQTATSRRLAGALEASGARCRSLAGRVRSQKAKAGASREQARQLCSTVQGRVSGSLAAAEASSRASSASLGESRQAHLRAVAGAARDAEGQRELLRGLAGSARSGCDALRERVSGAVAAAVKAITEEEQASCQGLAAAGAAAASAVGELRTGCAALAQEAERSERSLAERARTLEGSLGGESARQAEAALGVTNGLRTALAESQSAHTEAEAQHQRDVQRPLCDLQTRLATHAEGAGRLSDAARALRAQATADDDRSAARSSIARAATSALAAKRAGAAAEHVEPLGLLVEEMRTASARHTDELSGSLAAVAEQLAAARQAAADASERGRADLDAALERAEAAFRAAWGAASEELTALKGKLAQGAEAHRQERADDDADAEDCAAARTALEAAMRKEAAALADERAAVAREVEALRRQRAVEQEMLGTLAAQREALSSDVERIQASLADSEAAARSARASLAEAEEQQGRRREEAMGKVMQGVQELLKTEFNGLEEHLRQGASPVLARLDEISALSARATEATETAGRQALQTGSRAGELASQVAAGVEASCDELDATQRRSETAALAAAVAANAAAERLRSAEKAARGRGIRRAEGTTELEGAASTLQGNLDAQQALSAQWRSARESAEAASAAWERGCAAAVSNVGAAAQRRGAASAQAAAAHEELSGQCDAAASQLTGWAAAEHALRAALDDLSRKAAEGDAEAAAEASERRKALASLDDAASAAASASEAHARDARGLASAAHVAANARTRSSEAHWGALSASISAAELLREQAMQGGMAVSASVTELRELQAGSTRALKKAAEEVVERADACTGPMAEAEEQQRFSLAQAAKAAAERWEALRSSQAAAAQALERAVVEAEEASAAAAAAGGHQSTELEQRADAAFERAQEALEAQASQLAELSRLPSMCREALAAEPLGAFQEEGIFEDEPAELDDGAEGVPSLAEVEAVGRPSEEELVAEFVAGGRVAAEVEREQPTQAPQQRGGGGRRVQGLQSRVPSNTSLASDAQKPMSSPRAGASGPGKRGATGGGAGGARPALREMQGVPAGMPHLGGA